MKVIKQLLTLMFFIASITISAQDNFCLGCPANEEISVNSANNIVPHSRHEGLFVDLAYNPNTTQAIGLRFASTLAEINPLEIILLDVDKSIAEGVQYEYLNYQRALIEAYGLTQVAWSPSEASWIAFGNDEGIVTFWNLDDDLKIAESQGVADVREMIFHPDDARIITLEGNRHLLWHMADNEPVILTVPDELKTIRTIALSEDGRLLAVSGNDSIYLYDTDTNKILQIIEAQPSVDTLIFDSENLYALSNTIKRWRWSATNDRFVQESQFSPDISRSTRFIDATLAVDASLLVTLSIDGCIQLWDTATSQELTDSYHSEDEISSALCLTKQDPYTFVEMSSDGLWLVAGGYHGDGYDVGLLTLIVPSR